MFPEVPNFSVSLGIIFWTARSDWAILCQADPKGVNIKPITSKDCPVVLGAKAMKAEDSDRNSPSSLARRIVSLLCLIPLWNCAWAAAMGYFVVYSDADDYKFLAGVLSAGNVGGWLYWLYGSLSHIRDSLQKWAATPQPSHPGFRLAGLLSLCGAVSWVGVLFLLAYGMLA